MKATLFLTFFAWFLFQAPLFQQEPAVVVSAEVQPVSVFEMLEQHQPAEMTLKTDFKNLKIKRKDEYQAAQLSYTDKEGNPHQFDVEVRSRGNMRRATCEFPPLKIRFPSFEAEEKTLKMVYICQESKYYEQLILREYVAYRLYNLLTEQSLKAFLVKINYIDTNGKDSPGKSFAFFIEHEDELARRNNGRSLDKDKFSKRLLDSDEFERLCLFEFMIGNTDWHVYSGHNVKKFGIEGTAKIIFVPYDFDYSGLVDAPYSIHDEQLRLTNITDRYYMGLCRPPEVSQQNIQLFLDKKKEILQFCEEFPHFDKNSRNHVLNYLRSFFNIIENPKKCKKMIFDHCNWWPNS